MKKILLTFIVSTVILVSPLSYSSVLSDKMSGNQTQSTNKNMGTGETETNKTSQTSEQSKQTIVNNPKIDEFMGLSPIQRKTLFFVVIVVGFFVFGFGKFLLTGKQ